MSTSPPSARTTVKRRADRGAYDRAVVDAILDEAWISHVGFAAEHGPVVLPTMHARIGDQLYVHGSVASTMLRNLGKGGAACLTVTLLDGLVLAKSAFHHSMNYRSVVVFGMARVVDGDEKLAAMKALVERVEVGRWDALRPVNDVELRQTSVLGFSLDEASAKVRTGGPIDDPEDETWPVWTGVVPLPRDERPEP